MVSECERRGIAGMDRREAPPPPPPPCLEVRTRTIRAANGFKTKIKTQRQWRISHCHLYFGAYPNKLSTIILKKIKQKSTIITHKLHSVNPKKKKRPTEKPNRLPSIYYLITKSNKMCIFQDSKKW